MKKMLHIFFIIAIAVSALALTGVDACKSPTQPTDSTHRATVLDTTTNNFAFSIDTIGVGSHLSDIYALNDTDVWTVGEIHTNETDRVDSAGNWVDPYNAAHWDGKAWTLTRIYEHDTTSGIGSDSAIWYPTTVVAFGHNNIMVDGLHYDGNMLADLNMFFQKNTVAGFFKAWGKSIYDIYYVGPKGRIEHWDGNSYTSFPQLTTIDLTGIWGAKNAVYATGGDDFTYAGVLLKYDGSAWKVLQISDTGPDTTCMTNLCGEQDGVWCSSTGNLYLGGSFIYQGQDTVLRRMTGPGLTLTPYRTLAIQGIADNDVYAVGDYCETMHWNGIHWQEIRLPTDIKWENGQLWSISVTPHGCFVIGRLGTSPAAAVVLRITRL